MGTASKRSIDQVDGVCGGGAPEKEQQPSVLHRIRNMWQFANLCQWIYLFGKAVKINDDIDIDVCKPQDPSLCHPARIDLTNLGRNLKPIASIHGRQSSSKPVWHSSKCSPLIAD
jgi:hypothetical protein